MPAFGIPGSRLRARGGVVVMAAERWFIARNKTKLGPFSAGDLKQLARHGVLRPEEAWGRGGAGKGMEPGPLPGFSPRAGEKKYWLALAAQSRGPFVADQIRAGLNAPQFPLEPQACADDARQ